MHDVAHLIVRAGGRRAALPVDRVERLCEPGLVRAVPVTDPAVLGVIEVDGIFVSFVDLGRLLLAPGETGRDAAVLLRSARGFIALAVDEAQDLLRGEVMPLGGTSVLSCTSAILTTEYGRFPVIDADALDRALSGAALQEA